MEVFDLKARVQHLSELLNTVMMYEPDDLKREFGLLKILANTRAEARRTGLRDLLLQGIQPLPKGWNEAARRAMRKRGG